MRKEDIRRALSILGAVGGMAGKGRAKRRGDSAYYAALARKSAAARKAKKIGAARKAKPRGRA